MKKIGSVCLLALFILLANGEALAGRLHPALEAKLRTLAAGEKLAVIVELAEQANPYEIISAIPAVSRGERAWAVVNALRSVADQAQGPLRAHLKQQEGAGAAERVRPFWIFNGVAITATGPLVRSLASRPEVREVRLDFEIPVPGPTPAAAAAPSLSTDIAEWNVEAVRAPEVWALNPAYNGAGVVIGSFDTGVAFYHPDLTSRYRGNHSISWFDPYGEHGIPYDANGHGTHTTGTVVGGNGSGSFIGVAPGASWIAAKGWNDEGLGLASAFHEIFEWFLAPGGNPANAPDVVNCSWAFAEIGCDAEFLPDVQAWRAAGIFPAFASGNDGPGVGSVRCPGAYPEAFAVGATDVFEEVADFSGRGPSPCDGSVKPDISAPGDGVMSSVPGGGYDVLSGTSMATPHITGAVAVLRSINSGLTVDQLESALTSAAKDLAGPGLDNASGAGLLDLYVAAQVAILGPDIPVVKVMATDPVATESGPTTGSLEFRRTGNDDANLEVRFAVSGTAEAGSDYEPFAESVIIPAGSATATVLITALDDALAEYEETVKVTIAPDSAYIVSVSDEATVTIESDELLSDLVVSALSVPSTAGAGQEIAITDTVKNQGAGAADASVAQHFLSTNNTLDAGDLLVGSRAVPALAAGATSPATTTVTVPQGTAAGTWYLIAKADGEGVVTEGSETNNTSVRTIKIGPDLDITVMSAPATAGAGQAIAVTDTTKNAGGGGAGPTVTLFYLSANSSLDASDLLLGSRAVPALAAGESSSGSTSITIPEETAADTWYLIGKADGEDAVGETLETNNTYARSINIGPDLDLTTMSAPSASGAGQSIVITETIKNIGGGAAAASLTQFYLSGNSSLDASDTPLGSRAVPALAAGATSSASTTVTIPEGTATDTWYLIAKADAEDAVVETSETNNLYSRSINIGPDLDITSMSAPAASGAGQAIGITETTKNAGGSAAGSSVTQFYFSSNSTLDASDVLMGSRAVPALAAGASSTATTTVTVPQGTATGTWHIIGKADGADMVVETYETNNTYSRSITIGPDLAISSMTSPSSGAAGQTITVGDTTKNQGGSAAGASVTRYYLSSNSTWDASDVLVGGRAVPQLAAGATNSGSAAVTIPQGTAAGTWYIIGKADGEGVVVEISETNNTLARTIKII